MGEGEGGAYSRRGAYLKFRPIGGVLIRGRRGGGRSLLLCPSLRTGSFLLVGKFGAKRRASGACTHLPKSQLPPTRRTACQLSSFNQSARAESQNPQQSKNDTRETLVFACLFSRKNYLWFKSRDTKPRTITAKLRS